MFLSSGPEVRHTTQVENYNFLLSIVADLMHLYAQPIAVALCSFVFLDQNTVH